MERLAIMTPKGAALKMDDVYPCEDVARADLMGKYRLAVERLVTYEDTGLMPEEIKEVQEAMAPIPFGRFHDIMEAERAGRLVLLPESNTPLTLEELRQMDGEPVWVEFPKCPEASGWMLVDVNRHCIYNGLLGDCNFENCGKTWLACRHKTEEGTK